MAKISMKELDKFVKNNPNSHATQAIKEQLREPPAPEPNIGGSSALTVGSGQIRNTASDLAAEKVNELHGEVLNGFKDICVKAIAIGQILVGQKDALKHGEWLKWVDTQLDIGPRQVQNYIRIYCEWDMVMESMNELLKTGIKPSIRKMLSVATKKDNQTMEEYRENCQKDSPVLTPMEKKQRRKEEKTGR